jgi:hypothetical protein
MKFEATAHHEDAQYDLSTLDFGILMDFLIEHEEVYCEVVDGSTGEVLYYANCPNSDQPHYACEEFELMTLGYVYREILQKEDAEAHRMELVDAIQEVCEEFGVTLTIPN